MPISITNSTYTLTGIVINKSGDASGLTVKVFDKDTGGKLTDDFLSKTITDKEGNFTLNFDKSQFNERILGVLSLDPNPDIYFEVDYDNKILQNSLDINNYLPNIKPSSQVIDIYINEPSLKTEDSSSTNLETLNSVDTTIPSVPKPNYAPLSFTNNLSHSIVVYDCFAISHQPKQKKKPDLLGKLTKVGVIKAGETASITPIHGPISTYIVFNASNNTPISRYLSMGMGMGFSSPPFVITTEDVSIMTLTLEFVEAITKEKDTPLAKSFNSLLHKAKPNIPEINHFFKKNELTTNFRECTFSIFMLALWKTAQTTLSIPLPPEQKKYSAKSVVQNIGGHWPPEFPDIIIENLHCKDENDVFKLGGSLQLSHLTYGKDDISSGAVLGHITNLLGKNVVDFDFSFNQQQGLAYGALSLNLFFPKLSLPVPAPFGPINLGKPIVKLFVDPVFQFWILQVFDSWTFDVFNKPMKFDLDIAVDNLEISSGAIVKSQKKSILAPIDGLSNISFNEIGLGFGIFFKPPAFALGLEGKFQLGKNQSAVKDDQFAIVCKFDGDIPEPIYLSFYIHEIGFQDLLDTLIPVPITLPPDIDKIVRFSDLSLTWVENPLEPVILPDGQLTKFKYGFSGLINVFDFSMYGAVKIDLKSGLHGVIEMAPLNIGPNNFFSLSGDGKGITRKEIEGQPVKNNTIRATIKDHKIISESETMNDNKPVVVVPPNGPQITMTTSGSPYFSMDGRINFLDLSDFQITGSIGSKGMELSADFSALGAEREMDIIVNWQNGNEYFKGTYSFHLNESIPLPNIAGISLGSIPLHVSVDTSLALENNHQILDLTISGSFDFDGASKSFRFTHEMANLKTLKDVTKAIFDYIKKIVKELFKSLISDAKAWANAVKKELIKGFDSVAHVLKGPFKQTAAQTAAIMKSVGHTADDIAKGLANAYQFTASQVTSVMKGLKYSAKEISKSLQSAGYSAEEASKAIGSAFKSLGSTAIKGALEGAGYAKKKVGGVVDKLFPHNDPIPYIPIHFPHIHFPHL